MCIYQQRDELEQEMYKADCVDMMRWIVMVKMRKS